MWEGFFRNISTGTLLPTGLPSLTPFRFAWAQAAPASRLSTKGNAQQPLSAVSGWFRPAPARLRAAVRKATRRASPEAPAASGVAMGLAAGIIFKSRFGMNAHAVHAVSPRS